MIEPKALDPNITRAGGYMLSDLQDMNPVSLDLSSAKSSGVEVPKGLGDYISDLGNLSLSAEGIGSAARWRGSPRPGSPTWGSAC